MLMNTKRKKSNYYIYSIDIICFNLFLKEKRPAFEKRNPGKSNCCFSERDYYFSQNFGDLLAKSPQPYTIVSLQFLDYDTGEKRGRNKEREREILIHEQWCFPAVSVS